ncbi:MAG: hypothetical protein D6689_15280 [Deltaproteobacteria bacterium]|nr:MAG: hypothetical protein D6689_15280 [Deltaproteobacteria bacterium]
MPHLVFASPRALPRADRIDGRAAVLDIAFAATGGGVSFDAVTRPFIEGLGARLAAWVDHHDHERHADYADDPRFVLATKAEHGACPEMVTPEVVDRAGPVDTIVCHLDLDGLYAAAKWILGGREPYPGADADARCVDTRTGEPGPIARRIDRALRARFRDNELKRAVVLWLVGGMQHAGHDETIARAEAEFQRRHAGTEALARRYVVRDNYAFVDAGRDPPPYDKTELLLRGQQLADVAVVRDSGMVTIAAGFDSGYDFVKLLGLDGGMPTRVTIPESRLDEALAAIRRGRP